jgi:hypothetical protein
MNEITAAYSPTFRKGPCGGNQRQIEQKGMSIINSSNQYFFGAFLLLKKNIWCHLK